MGSEMCIRDSLYRITEAVGRWSMIDISNGHAQARVRKNNTFLSAVWLVPLIALIAGGWLWVKEIRI